MNLKYHLLVAAAALSLGACSTDDTNSVPENEGYKISFTVAEDAETRTTFDASDFLRWVPTDKVEIYTVGKNENPNTLTVADVNQHPVEFIGVLKKLVSSGDMFYAYYPYNAAQSADPSSVKLSIPAEQKQTAAGVYNGESHPLVALPMAFQWEQDSYAGRISSVRFRQLGAIVELQLYSSDEALRSEKIRSVTFESDTPLAGNFTFNLTTVADTEELPISGYESKTATTSIEEPAAIPATKDEAARIYLTIAPGTYMGQIVVKTDVTQYTFRLAEAMTFKRAAITGLPADLAETTREASGAEDYLIEFEDSIVKEICINNWDTNGDGELSYKEAAAVTSISSQFQISQKTLIRSFNELQYFTGLPYIEKSTFDGYSNLKSITLPDQVYGIAAKAFQGCSSLTSLHIPDAVTLFGHTTFKDCSSLTSIKIPNGVTVIGENMFYGCSSLTSIDLPETVTEIYPSAFYECSSLKSIHLPETVTSIGYYAFYNCESLTSITIPKGMTEIKNSVFGCCRGLTSITIPEGVTTIEEKAFVQCNSLPSITIPNSVTSIGEEVFVGCSSLTAFNGKRASADHRCLIEYGSLLAFAPANLTEYTIPNGVVKIGSCTFKYCKNLTSVTIPDGVAEIGNSAFYYCSSLTSITIPKTVTTIGDFAFEHCESLASVYCKPTTPPTIGRWPFTNIWCPMTFYVPAASVEAYKTAGWGNDNIFADNN